MDSSTSFRRFRRRVWTFFPCCIFVRCRPSRSGGTCKGIRRGFTVTSWKPPFAVAWVFERPIQKWRIYRGDGFLTWPLFKSLTNQTSNKNHGIKTEFPKQFSLIFPRSSRLCQHDSLVSRHERHFGQRQRRHVGEALALRRTSGVRDLAESSNDGRRWRHGDGDVSSRGLDPMWTMWTEDLNALGNMYHYCIL